MSIAEIRSNVPPCCITDRCSEEGCSVSLDGIQPANRVVVDCREFKRRFRYSDRLCDCVVICDLNDISVSVIELKSGGIDASQVIGQIRNGTRLVEEWIGGANVRTFLPLLVHSKGIHAKQWNVLRKKQNKIVFGGKAFPVSTARSGSSLKEVLQRS